MVDPQPDLILPLHLRTSMGTSHENLSMYAIAVRQLRAEDVKISFEVERGPCSTPACREELTPDCVPSPEAPGCYSFRKRASSLHMFLCPRDGSSASESSSPLRSCWWGPEELRVHLGHCQIPEQSHPGRLLFLRHSVRDLGSYS